MTRAAICLFCLLLQRQVVAADPVSHAQVDKTFAALLEANREANPMFKYIASRDSDAKPTAKFSIAATPNPQAGEPPISLAVKFWGRSLDGIPRCVNLQEYRWRPGERFELWLQTAAPVRIALFYHPHDMQPVMVVPDPQFPSTQSIIEPGRDVCFPVPFKMDDNQDDEMMTVVIIHAAAVELEKKEHGGTRPLSNHEALDALRRVLRPVKAAGARNTLSRDFGIEYVSTQSPTMPDAATPNPVQLQIQGSSNIAQYSLVLKKK